jgi:threonine/homoserine/homoserine lactone efflux protein
VAGFSNRSADRLRIMGPGSVGQAQLLNILLFASVVGLSALSPGPNVILVINHSLTFGFWRIAPTILGNLSLQFLVALSAVLGASALLAKSPILYDALRLLGAAYLAWLGVRALLAAWRTLASNFEAVPVPNVSAGRRYAQAFFVSATNLQSVFFLATLFPNFLDDDWPVLPQFIVLFATLIHVIGTVHLGYAALASLLQAKLGVDRFRQIVQVASGAALLAFSWMIVVSVMRGD